MKAEIHNFRAWVEITDPGSLKEIFSKLLTLSGHTICNFIEKYFEPHGYTALWLLAESHFAVHTFPEDQKTYIELSSCNKDFFDNWLKNINMEQIYFLPLP